MDVDDDWLGFGNLHHGVGNGDVKEPELSIERDLNYVIKDHGFTFCIRKLNCLLVHEMSKR